MKSTNKLKATSLAIIFVLLGAINSIACSSFALKTKTGMIYGRNLDSPDRITGSIFINKRGVYKESITFIELYLGRKLDVPRLNWISNYGSITFNNMGAEFPDGGMNEAGLFFEEMTLLETQYPTNYTTPTMHMEQWIQYVLDNFATVEEVVENAKKISIDGWNWHYFVADKSGKSAVIEFLNGKVVVTMGASLLCNSSYSDELIMVDKYSKTNSLDSLGKDKRFLFGKQAIENYNENSNKSAVDYGFEILKALDPEPLSITQLSKIYDVGNQRVYFKTTKDTEIKSIDLNEFDFSCDAPRKMLGVNTDLKGNVTDRFSNYTANLNLESEKQGVFSFVKNPDVKAYLESEGVINQEMIDRIAGFPSKTYCKE